MVEIEIAKYCVVYLETGETRIVWRGCKRCRVDLSVDFPNVIVSSSGLAHYGRSLGDTDCGLDATGDGWWWPE